VNTNPTTPARADGPQQVTLPDSLIRAIILVAADPQAPPIAVLEAAVLITFGYALYRRHDTIDPTQVAIPTAQWHTICQALVDVRTWSGLGGINLGLDWVNLGPAAHDDKPAWPRAETPALDWADEADHPVADWQHAVTAGATRLGYAHWVTGMRALRLATAQGERRANG
jgi:hypothetical protein